jgi:hypothetical protein
MRRVQLSAGPFPLSLEAGPGKGSNLRTESAIGAELISSDTLIKRLLHKNVECITARIYFVLLMQSTEKNR